MQSGKSFGMGQPLSGLKVIEFCHVAAGPFCGMLLADMGAEVIKVEPPDGDTMRQWPPLTDGFSENFVSLNRNKRSVVLDLKSEEGKLAAWRLISTADAVVENNRPGVMKRLGLGYEDLAPSMPKLVYCSISAFGQTGPKASEGGFDLTIQALSGIMSVTGEPEGAPVKCGVPISDFSSGLYAAFAIAAMLVRVKTGGTGGNVDVSMLATSLAVSALQSSEYFGTGQNPRRLGSAHPRNAPYQAYEARDGYFVVAAGNNKLWKSFCSVIGRSDLPLDPRFENTSDRAKHQADLAAVLAPEFRKVSVDDLLRKLSGAGVPCGRINNYAEALSHPQIQHQGFVTDIELPNGGRTQTFGSPLRIGGTIAPIRRAPPMLGQHTKEVLAELESGDYGRHT